MELSAGLPSRSPLPEPPGYGAAFARRLAALAADIDVDFVPYDTDPRVRAWLFGLFRDNGAMTTEHLAPHVMARRLRLAGAAVAALERDLVATGYRCPASSSA